ncbi:MAG: hypothetical protein L3J09_11505 [Flavobacteriaceae bacterium]|nr:hypothetical protein [Flavobacteriaceae bacterium]
MDKDNLLIEHLSTNLSESQLDNFLDFNKKWKWINLAFIPFLLFLKITVISTILNIGFFLFKKNISFKKIFYLVVKAEYIFLFVITSKIIWFYFFKQNYTVEYQQYFYPLSAINIIGYDNLYPWWVYFFQVLNVFELFYWISLSYLISKEIKVSIEYGLKIVASSYGLALVIWIFGTMFIALNAS